MRSRVRSVLAVVAGFAATAVASILTDALMRALMIFPAAPQSMSDSLFAIAALYRAVFTVVGAFITARLAPARPAMHAAFLAAIGFVAGAAGLVVYFMRGGGQLGPIWYAIAIPLEAFPCVYLGAQLAMRKMPPKRN